MWYPPPQSDILPCTMNPDRSETSQSLRSLLICQGLYYTVTGVWPLLDRRTFEAMTGPKADFWLVRTVGALVAVVGGTLILAAVREEAGPEVRVLAVGSAGTLAAVDINYAAKGRIANVYLLDAAAQLGLISWHLAARR